MTTLPTAIILADSAVARETRSALPDAPIVETNESRHRAPVAARPRVALARALERAARVVAPATSYSPAP